MLISKSIDNILNNKIQKLFDDEVLSLINSKVILGGGSLRKLVDKSDKLIDYDLFFLDRECVEPTKEALLKLGFVNTYSCKEGKLFTYKKRKWFRIITVQLILEKIYESMYDVVNSFDIIACCCAMDTKTMVEHSDFESAVLNKLISFNNIEYPVATLRRIIKYSNKGYFLGKDDSNVYLTSVINNPNFDSRIYID